MSMQSCAKCEAEAVCHAVQGGLIARLFQHLFERLRDSEREQRNGLQLSYICKVSCLEIYQVGTPPERIAKTVRGTDHAATGWHFASDSSEYHSFA